MDIQSKPITEMTVRDFYAGLAMHAIVSNDYSSRASCGFIAYAIADHMIEMSKVAQEGKHGSSDSAPT